MVDLMNEIRYKKIYRYDNIDEDLKGKSVQWIIEATNHSKFSSLSPFYVIEGGRLISICYVDIDFTDLAEYLFCRYSVWNKMPESVQEVLDHEEVFGNYKWEFVNYAVAKSGATEEEVEAYLESIKFDYRKNWFDLYCDFISLL